MREKQASQARAGVTLALLTLASRVLGLAREMTKAALMGTSALSDAFSTAFLIPNLFRRLFAEGSISTAFIPVFKRCPPDPRARETREYLDSFCSILVFFTSLAVGCGMLLTPLIVPLFGPGLFDETVLLTRLLFPFLLFMSVAALFQGVLNGAGVFAPSGFAPVALNIVTIACAWLLKDRLGNGARAMAVGVLAGGFLSAAIQLPFILRRGFRIRPRRLKAALANAETRATLRLIGPTLAGMAAYQFNDLASSALARRAGEGTLSSLQYSLRLQELILGVFAVSIGTVLLPGLAGLARKADWKTYNERLLCALNTLTLVTIPVTFFSLASGERIIRLLFQFKSFDEESVRLTLDAFRFHIAGLFFIAQNRLLAPAFYARADAASPARAGIISFAVNIALAASLSQAFRGAGIACALSVAGAVNTAALLVMLKKKEGESARVIPAAARYALKIAALSALAMLPLLACRSRLADLCAAALPPRLALAATLALCAVVFGLPLLALLKAASAKP